MPAYANDVLVDTDWVQEHLDDESIRIVEVDENPALYAEAHIPGAIGFDWKRTCRIRSSATSWAPRTSAAVRLARDLQRPHDRALRRPQQLVRGLHVLVPEVLRPRQVKLVNGPREKWIAEGRPTTADVAAPTRPRVHGRPGDDTIRAQRHEVLAALNDGTRLVDVRSPQEFSAAS